MKKASNIQYGYWKYGIPAQVLSQTLAHGYNNDKIRHISREESKKTGVKMEGSTIAATEKPYS